MKTPLAWKNLSHNRVRTAVGVAGVGFAAVLIFMQLGFQGAIRKTATQIYDALDFDLMLRSPAYLHLTEPRSFPRARIFQAASLPEITVARPFYLGFSEWQAPLHASQRSTNEPPDEDDPSGDWRSIITMGTNPNDPGFTHDDICRQVRLLTDARFVLVDSKSKPEYGPVNKSEFTSQDIGVQTSLGPNRVQIVGLFQLGTGMASNGACLTNPEGFVRACPWQAIDEVNFGLLKLRESTSSDEVKKRLYAIYGIPEPIDGGSLGDQREAAAMTYADVEILTRQEVNDHEEHRWVVDTPLGQIFGLGVWVALFVGVAIVYQVLSTDIANMMAEYATLKAMGYNNSYLTKVVLLQSVLLALVSYVPSAAISWVLYRVVEQASGLPMAMSGQIMFAVLLLAIGMCVISAVAALRQLYRADPADLF